MLSYPIPPQEWPQVREASVSYLAPTLRPPDLPEQKPQRPHLMYRIAHRLKNYWYPPIPGNIVCVLMCYSVFVSLEITLHFVILNVPVHLLFHKA